MSETAERFGPGDVIADRYRIEGAAGAGGMGEVYAARQLSTDLKVALKVLRPAHRDGGARMLREARILAALRSPYAARVVDAGTLASGDPFIAFEFLEGADLAAILLARGRLGSLEAIDIVLKICGAVAEAHDRGIVHRDIKPSNIFLEEQTSGAVVPKLLDFGIAKIEGGDATLTASGRAMGSPRYMSPEQIRDPKGVGVRSDVWSLGVTLHELVTGHAPFEGDHAPALCAMIAHEAPTLRLELAPDAPRGLASIVQRCLVRDPEGRFRDAHALAGALEALLRAPGHVDESSDGPATLETPGTSTPKRTVQSAPTQHPIEPVRRRPRRWMLPGALALGATIATGVVLAFSQGKPPAGKKPTKSSQAPAVATSNAVPRTSVSSPAAEPPVLLAYTCEKSYCKQPLQMTSDFPDSRYRIEIASTSQEGSTSSCNVHVRGKLTAIKDVDLDELYLRAIMRDPRGTEIERAEAAVLLLAGNLRAGDTKPFWVLMKCRYAAASVHLDATQVVITDNPPALRAEPVALGWTTARPSNVDLRVRLRERSYSGGSVYGRLEVENAGSATLSNVTISASQGRAAGTAYVAMRDRPPMIPGERRVETYIIEVSPDAGSEVFSVVAID